MIHHPTPSLNSNSYYSSSIPFSSSEAEAWPNLTAATTATMKIDEASEEASEEEEGLPTSRVDMHSDDKVGRTKARTIGGILISVRGSFEN